MFREPFDFLDPTTCDQGLDTRLDCRFTARNSIGNRLIGRKRLTILTAEAFKDQVDHFFHGRTRMPSRSVRAYGEPEDMELAW